MKLLNIAIGFYVAMNIIFAMSAIFGLKNWDLAYFMCQDTGGGGWLLWYILYLNAANYKKQVLPVLIYSSTIFVWDIISYLTGWGVNHPIATGIAFGLGTLIVVFYMAKDIYERWVQK